MIGGFSGKGLPTVTVKSNGEFSCGEDEPLNFDIFDSEGLQLLSQIMTVDDCSFKKPSAPNQAAAICSDCYRTQILVARRAQSGKVKTYQSDGNKVNSETFLTIQQKMFDLEICRN